MAKMTNGNVNSCGSTPLIAAMRTARETERTMAARYPPRSYFDRSPSSVSERVSRQSLERLRTSPWLST